MSNQVWRLRITLGGTVSIDPWIETNPLGIYPYEEGIYSSETQALEALAMIFRANIKRMLSHGIFGSDLKEKFKDASCIQQLKEIAKLKLKLIKFYNKIGEKLQPVKFYKRFIERNFDLERELTLTMYSSYPDILGSFPKSGDWFDDSFFFPIACDTDHIDKTLMYNIELESFELDQWLNSYGIRDMDLPETIEE